MARERITLKRIEGTSLDPVPLTEMALGFLESVEGITDIRVERCTPTVVELTFAWDGEESLVIPEHHLYRFGLVLVR